MPIYEQFNFRKISMAAILKSAQKGGGGPTYKAFSIIDQWGPLNKMIPLMEDPGGARWPLWAHGLSMFIIYYSTIRALVLIVCSHIPFWI